jgi:hypothetical protein
MLRDFSSCCKQHVSMLRRDFFHLNKFDSYSTDLNVLP